MEHNFDSSTDNEDIISWFRNTRVLGQYNILLADFYMFRSHCFSFSIHFLRGSREVENDIVYTKRKTSS